MMQFLTHYFERLGDPFDFAQVIVHRDPHFDLEAEAVWQYVNQPMTTGDRYRAKTEAQSRFQCSQLRKVVIRGNREMLIGFTQPGVDQATQVS